MLLGRSVRFFPCLIAVAWCANGDGASANDLGPRLVQLSDGKEKSSSDEDLPRLKAHPIDGPFCSQHFLGNGACRQCLAAPARQRSLQAKGGEWDKAHLLYLHAQKTGGSTLECATQGNQLQSRWTNMGHTHKASVASCIHQCTFDGVAPKVIVMIRDPYEFWASRFLFAWECKLAASCTGSYGITHFHQFLRFIDNHMRMKTRTVWHPQHIIMYDQCGNPCEHDFLLHTETMQEDWLELMDKIGEPRTLLPQTINPTRTGNHPPIEFDAEALEIIRRIDGPMFDVWGYKERKESFSLNANVTARLWQE